MTFSSILSQFFYNFFSPIKRVEKKDSLFTANLSSLLNVLFSANDYMDSKQMDNWKICWPSVGAANKHYWVALKMS